MNTPRQSRVRRLTRTFLATSCLALAPGLALAQAVPTQHWVGTWGASPSDPLPTGATTPGYANQTLREIAHVSIGGGTVRVRLSNALGTSPLVVGAAHVALSAGNDAIAPRSDRALTFSGRTSFTIPIGALADSDPVALAVAAQSDLAVSIFLPQATGALSEHQLGVQTSYVAAGNDVAATRLPSPATTLTRPLLAGIDVYAPARTAAVVTFGDSITDGYNSTVDLDRRWPDDLARRLRARFGNAVSIVNEGISGNRVLNDSFGPNAQQRLDRDVLAAPGARYVTLLEGINDIGFPHFPPGTQPIDYSGQEVSADDIIAGYRQIVTRAHDRGLKVYGGTLTPFLGTFYATPEGEAKREAVNAFIRSSGLFDAVLDFDAAVRDPANPTHMLAAYDSGDHLHPNDAGYEAMAYSIDLSLFSPDAS